MSHVHHLPHGDQRTIPTPPRRASRHVCRIHDEPVDRHGNGCHQCAQQPSDRRTRRRHCRSCGRRYAAGDIHYCDPPVPA
jgi:hypothetical protein